MTDTTKVKATVKTKRLKPQAIKKTGATLRLNAHIDPEDLTTIVAIFTRGRTGTSLISSLLDSHSWVATTPDNIMIGFYVFWEEFGDLERNELIEAFIDQYETLFDGAKPSKNPKCQGLYGDRLGFTTMGENRDQIFSADVDVFRSSLREILPRGKTIIRRFFMQALHVAYADAIGHRLEKGAIISIGLHSSSLPVIMALSEDFKEARFLYMVRDPIQTMGSCYHNVLSSDSDPDVVMKVAPSAFLKTVRARFLSGSPGLENVKFQSRAVRLEDLHRSPKRTLSAICGWLGIPWDNTLLHSTFNGLQYWNDKRSAYQTSGFNEKIISQKHEAYIPRFDRFRYTVMFARRFQAFGYFLHNTILRQRIVFVLLFPLFVFPFSIEILTFKGNWGLEVLKYFIKFRLMAARHTFSPSDTVPLLSANCV